MPHDDWLSEVGKLLQIYVACSVEDIFMVC